MTFMICLLYIGLLAALIGGWIHNYGIRKGSIAGFFRVGWTLPFLSLWFPHTRLETLPAGGKSTMLHVLVDDSESMKLHRLEVENWKIRLISNCEKVGCQLAFHQLSHIEPETKQGISPLYRGWKKWRRNVSNQPWIFLSDGGDSFSEIPSQQEDIHTTAAGMVIGVGKMPLHNLWIESIDTPALSFDSQSVPIFFQLKRDVATAKSETLQVQITEGNKIQVSQNIVLPEGANDQKFSIELPPLRKGTHLFTFRILPQKDQVFLWGNERAFSIETMPNTLGVLHLLGAPSWDGRFLRRYFKSEPKFDLVNFFILRDPWDEQDTQERNISLVQFPVEKLFTKELPNFRLIVMQNFALSQFLELQYQENLVRFVQAGGSLLFIGGPRALSQVDLTNSPLRKIFPFSIGASPTPYDENQSFRIRLATPSPEKRALATVYEEWVKTDPFLSRMKEMKGLHRGQSNSLRADAVTPLLEAELPSGERVPLVVASYPGKGRALWVLSDSFWRLALAKSQGIPRSLYQDLWEKGLEWLLHQELQQPLTFQSIEIEKERESKLHIHATLYGPAIRYWDQTSWLFSLCGVSYPLDQFSIHRYSVGDLELEGDIPIGAVAEAGCKVQLRGSHERFGSISLEKIVPILKPRPDQDIAENPEFLRKISLQSKALFVSAGSESEGKFDKWILDNGADRDILPTVRSRTVSDIYWVFHGAWIWLLLFFAFGEIFVRRYL